LLDVLGIGTLCGDVGGIGLRPADDVRGIDPALNRRQEFRARRLLWVRVRPPGREDLPESLEGFLQLGGLITPGGTLVTAGMCIRSYGTFISYGRNLRSCVPRNLGLTAINLTLTAPLALRLIAKAVIGGRNFAVEQKLVGIDPLGAIGPPLRLDIEV